MDSSSLIAATIQEVLTPLCEPVHPAWVDRNTTPVATSMTILRLADGQLVMVAPCEVEVEVGKYPSLGISVQGCEATALQWVRDGTTYSMKPFGDATGVLPFQVTQIEESDPLGEGAVSEIVLVGADGSRLLFRHIMPPMSLGIVVTPRDQAPNNSFKGMPLCGTP